MKIYVNWKWKQIVKTREEAKKFMLAKQECYDFNDYLSSTCSSMETVFNFNEAEKAAISKAYLRYLEKAIDENWEIVEI